MKHYYYHYYDETLGDNVKVEKEVSREEAKNLLENCYTDVDLLLDVLPCPSIYPLMGCRQIIIEED